MSNVNAEVSPKVALLKVMAYALAHDVYGELPLPAGVHPWTVMEYHLKGEPQVSRNK